MAAYKLDRIEELAWNPPELTFVIERHGAIVAGGSSRAEKQKWTVNLDTLTADSSVVGFRRHGKAQPPLGVKPLVDRVLRSVRHAVEDPSVERLTTTTARIRVSLLIPGDGPKQTISSRRKRFRKLLEERLAELGWERAKGRAPYTYERVS